MESSVSMPTLRPLTVLEILDRAFRIYRTNFLTFIGYAALIIIPINVINYLATQSATVQPNNFFQSGTASSSFSTLRCIVLLLTVIQSVLLNAVLAYIGSEQHLGRSIGISEAFRGTQGRFLTLFFAQLVFGFLLGGLGLVTVFASAACALGVVGFGLIIYLAITVNSLLVPTVVLENVGVGQAINRSWWLAKSRFWNVVLLQVLLSILLAVFQVGLFLVASALATQPTGRNPLESTQNAYNIILILNVVVTILITPLTPIAQTLFYYDTRVRLEGLDLALQATNNPDARPSDIASPVTRGGLTGQDLINIVIIIAIVGGAFLLFSQVANSIFSSLVSGLPVQ